MPTAADRRRWDDLHASYATARAAADEYRSSLQARYGYSDPRWQNWITRAERAKLERFEGRADKIGDKIIDLLVRISPRGEAWLTGAPAWWIREKLTWEDAIRPAEEPLSVVAPAPYGSTEGLKEESSYLETPMSPKPVVRQHHHPVDADRVIIIYDYEALQLFQNWWAGQGDPLYAIYSSGGEAPAEVIRDALANIETDIGKVKKTGKKYHLGKGTFSKKDIDELYTIRDALAAALAEGGEVGEVRGTVAGRCGKTEPSGPVFLRDENILLAKYSDLVRMFGQPHMVADPYKTAFEWKVGDVVIYDYKATNLYAKGAPTPHDIQSDKVTVEWHVQGSTPSIYQFEAALASHGAHIDGAIAHAIQPIDGGHRFGPSWQRWWSREEASNLATTQPGHGPMAGRGMREMHETVSEEHEGWWLTLSRPDYGTHSLASATFAHDERRARVSALTHARQGYRVTLHYGADVIDEYPPLTSKRARETQHLVADFSTLPELIAHAQREGATHVSVVDGETRLYFPLEDGWYAESCVWSEGGYWHTHAPGERKTIDRLPANAEPIVEHSPAHGLSNRRAMSGPQGGTIAEAGGHAVRDYIAVDVDGRAVAGPFRDYGEAKQHADQEGGYVEFILSRNPPRSTVRPKRSAAEGPVRGD
jgi:hypothetical protein